MQMINPSTKIQLHMTLLEINAVSTFPYIEVFVIVGHATCTLIIETRL